MLVQRRERGVRLFRQHEHGLATGELAHRWRCESSDSLPLFAILAAALHDLPWEEEDRRPRWNPDTQFLHHFWDIPARRRYRIYRDGLDSLEPISPEVALLCSWHYGSFATGEEGESFSLHEENRRRKIVSASGMSAAEVEHVQRHLSVLQNLDLLSLFLCLAPPDARHDGLPGWVFRSPSVFDVEYRLRWTATDTLSIDPFPFDQEVVLHHRCFDLDGYEFLSAEQLADAWQRRREAVYRVCLQPPT